MLNANTARLKTIEAINTNTSEVIDLIYKDIEDAISKGRFNTTFSIFSTYNRSTGEANVRIDSKVIKCNLTNVIEFFEEKGFKCGVEEVVDAYNYMIDRRLGIIWK